MMVRSNHNYWVKVKWAKQIGKGIMCLGSGVEFLISAGGLWNKGRTQLRRGEARRDSAALIWVTGLWGTVITPLSSSDLSGAPGLEEPALMNLHTVSHTFPITEVSFSWNTRTLSLVCMCGSISNTSKSRLFLFSDKNGMFVQLQFKNMFGTWRDRDRPRGLHASPLIRRVPVPGHNKVAFPHGLHTESHAKQNFMVANRGRPYLVVVNFMQLDNVRVAIAELQGCYFPLCLCLHPAANTSKKPGNCHEIQHKYTGTQ